MVSVNLRNVSFSAQLLFLEYRPHNKETASLMASSAGGWIRAWSVHHNGGLLGQFHSSHKPGESVMAMTTDSKNEFLMVGDTLGYVKVRVYLGTSHFIRKLYVEIIDILSMTSVHPYSAVLDFRGYRVCWLSFKKK